MSFKDMVTADVKNVFLNLAEFGEPRTILYDGETYEDIPVVLTGRKETSRRKLEGDNAQGIYQAAHVLHCALEDLGGNQPEQGSRIQISDRAGPGAFSRTFYVASSICEMGMLRLDLEAMDE